MVIVEVCIGSACFVKGSNQLIELIQELIRERKWEEKVVLKGAFCMQACSKGLGMKVNGTPLYGVGLHNAVELITAEIEQLLK